jgi:Family of unknown function (DUF6335)
MAYPSDRKTTPALAEIFEPELESDMEPNIDFAESAPEVAAMHSCDAGGVVDPQPDDSDCLQPQDLLTGGDRDTDPYPAEVFGEETIGGTTPTPDQNVVEDLAVSVGIETPDQGILHTSEMLERRDARRWELDPQSSEDYERPQD